ncbi:hypothetical protein RRG08_053963 [Elysia crispata]|uniref:Uncharacterized protein n=1 Tax=Elysia crispata TaxID=231223 RepID=A0AAE1DFB6_9GAST|nr:hypothetical protein RRG08_053963 [Elysia crispata]
MDRVVYSREMELEGSSSSEIEHTPRQKRPVDQGQDRTWCPVTPHSRPSTRRSVSPASSTSFQLLPAHTQHCRGRFTHTRLN